jgi:heptosyltransferase-3
MITVNNIALFPSPKLGDGFLFLIIANNLHRNGYQVTYYNDFIYQLQNWLPWLNLKPSPNKATIEKIFSEFDLVIAHNNSVIIESFPASKCRYLAKRCVFITTSHHINKDLVFNHKVIKNNLTRASGGCIANFGENCPLAERVTNFCSEVMQLDHVVNSCNLQPPANLQHRKYLKRIIIHPTSGKPNKNWPINKYIKLAKLLTNQEWRPVFCLSPNERKEWLIKTNDDFLLPEFTTIDSLAQFIYESGYMIGNDSGVSHLASSLGIPTLTIMNPYDHFYWRPGWAIGKTVTPAFKLPKLHKKYWRYLIPVKKVLTAFNKLASIA